MRILPTKLHGILDYLYVIALICAPFLFWTTAKSWDLWIPLLAATAVLLYSLVTDYEWGGISLLSMPSHLTLDLILGVLLAASPWIFGFADVTWLPFVIFGLLAIIFSFITKKEPGKRVVGLGRP